MSNFIIDLMSFGKKWKQKQEIGTVQFLDAYYIHNEDWRDYETK